MEFTLIKQWLTGGKAEMDSQDFVWGLFEVARDWMYQSKLEKLPGHQAKPSDVTLWKQFSECRVQKGIFVIRLF